MKTLLLIFFVSMSSLAQAIDSRGVLPLLVQVVDAAGTPIEGLNVALPQVEIQKLKNAARALGMSPSEEEHACRAGTTDKLGFALIYYSGGTQSTSNGYACTLPSSIEINRQGTHLLTIDLSQRGMLSVKPNEPVVPHITATLVNK